MQSDIAMVELVSEDHLSDQRGQLQTKFKQINFACNVQVEQSNGREFLLVEVPDCNRDVVDLVTEKLNEVGVYAMCYPWHEMHAAVLGKPVEV